MSAFLIVHIETHLGCTWTDPLAVFPDRESADVYLDSLREREDPFVDDDGWSDSKWHIRELPISPTALPEKKNYRWVLSEA